MLPVKFILTRSPEIVASSVGIPPCCGSLCSFLGEWFAVSKFVVFKVVQQIKNHF